MYAKMDPVDKFVGKVVYFSSIPNRPATAEGVVMEACPDAEGRARYLVFSGQLEYYLYPDEMELR